MFFPLPNRHLRSLALVTLLAGLCAGAALTPAVHATAGDCASLLAFPKPPPVPLSFPKPPPVPLGGISGNVFTGNSATSGATISLYRCAGSDAVLVEQATSGSAGAYAFAGLSAEDTYYVEVPGSATQGAYAVPGMTGVTLQTN